MTPGFRTPGFILSRAAVKDRPVAWKSIANERISLIVYPRLKPSATVLKSVWCGWSRGLLFWRAWDASGPHASNLTSHTLHLRDVCIRSASVDHSRNI